MLRFPRRLVLFLAFAAVAVSARAQTIYSNPASGSSFPVASGSSAIQLFTNTTEVTGATWSLVGGSASTTFSSYVAAWNTGTETAGATIGTFGTLAFNPGAGTPANLNFTGTTISELGAGNTYALILTNLLGASNPQAYFGTGFGSGDGATGDYSAYIGDPGSPSLASEGWAVVMAGTAGEMSPVPEPKAAATGIALLFVAVLVGRQRWLRRKAALAPVAVRIAA